MAGFIQGVDRAQATLLPEYLEDWADESNPVRVIDAFVEGLDLGGLGFSTVAPADTGRPGYHPAVMLKLYIYGYNGCLKLSDAERATLGEIGHRLGRKGLAEVATVAKPDTILAWYRKLVTHKLKPSPF
jgi:hypothetical protein